MLAYLFWHRPYASIDAAHYEVALIRFHQRLAAQQPRGFLGSASFRISPVDWLHDQSGYEDWCLLNDSSALDPLNTIAVSDPMVAAHDAAAEQMEEGHGGLYSLVWGQPDLPERSQLVWLTRPRGIQWRPVLDSLRQSAPLTACWRRQMVLGPGKEFAILVPQGQTITPPRGWLALPVDRYRVQSP